VTSAPVSGTDTPTSVIGPPTSAPISGTDTPTSVIGQPTGVPPSSVVSQPSDTVGVPTSVVGSISITDSVVIPTGPVASVNPSSLFPTSVSDSLATGPLSTVIPSAAPVIPSQFSFLTASSLEITHAPSASVNPTITDPDVPQSMIPVSATGTAVATPTLPPNLPQQILPNPPLDMSPSNLDGDTFVTIAFNLDLNFQFVAGDLQTQGQIFLYMPILLGSVLGVDQSQVKSYALKPFAASDWNGQGDDLYTLYQAYIPSGQVDTLQHLIDARNSALFTQAPSGISAELAQEIITGFPLLYSTDPQKNPSGSGSGSSSQINTSALSSADKSRRNAIIGVCAAVGGIALLVLGWWLVRTYKRRQENNHHRLNEPTNYGATGQMAERPPSVGPDGIRRNSFYFAEDSLRGFTNPSRPDDEEANGGQGQGISRRSPVGGQQISGPILRQNTLGY